VLASFFAKTASKRVLLGIPDGVCEADFVLRVCGRSVGGSDGPQLVIQRDGHHEYVGTQGGVPVRG